MNLPVIVAMYSVLVLSSAVTVLQQEPTLASRASAISAVLEFRGAVLLDAPLGGCGVFRALDSRQDYLTLLDSTSRLKVEIASPEPCSPDPISVDSTITAYEKRRRMLARRPRAAELISIRQPAANRYVVELRITLAGMTYEEHYALTSLSQVVPPGVNPLRVVNAQIVGIVIH